MASNVQHIVAMPHVCICTTIERLHFAAFMIFGMGPDACSSQYTLKTMDCGGKGGQDSLP